MVSMNIGPTSAADLYAVAMVKKEQDEQKRAGEQAVRLIEQAGGGPRQIQPGPDSTVAVVA